MNKAVLSCTALVVTALLFNAGIYFVEGRQKALEFLTGYVIELSLSVDNLFVFLLIFSHFKLPAAQQSRVLTWGVVGAQLMRAIFIVGGIALLRHWNWVIYAFGGVLIFSGIKIFAKKDRDIRPEQNIVIRFFNRSFPPVSSFWMVLIAVELADVVFALDSIPAVLAVTKDPFIVYTSNIFAILGLRAMYLALAPMLNLFHYLHYGLGIILVFVGFKMVTGNFWPMPVSYTLGFIILVVGAFATASLIRKE